ncbi:MAG: exodeoxyribonuclease III [Epsilonproteobacteria bacterium]|nr:exodeoxyribonuclease III [Campylobacterota bacterium]OIO15078.1 MAG: exodeoxyribonuclease III [Helicobacteraceae bacterium CG1_02_36_14]PIP11014.1 MAG: exodeoxyribonuclease III [Sulfurimonas sp. CG23_combo_of_CG06-09_8_20_14_all_36_33]PIS25399.1 MAG: exodeoxyribonuclease III [Sulfurimonas sp. CG08_land_8_20_14_0_20_36_33]PIU36092.1 MAG: exodeoxyribonuclease III [Sulfurimonas sp. CG07_land_8_20_14_0_80_36_56]PIV02391.1 MAG: exodeoxyribonuclease III [Sulfurimonas sp. CG03_land_8_20_14_0_80_36
MSNSIEIISWNVNGIRAVGNKEALKWIDERETDILCLQEIKALEEQIPESLFDKSYKDIIVNSAQKKGYSGTMTWSDIQSDYNSTCQHVDTMDEGRIVETHYDDIVLFNVYFPNGQKDEERLAYKMKFYDDFLAYCEKLREDGKSIIICGDVNTAHKEIDLKNPKANSKTSGFLPIEREWIDTFLACGYVDTFRYVHGDKVDSYSWWSYRSNARANNVGWRIDYFFISEDLCESLEDAFILEQIEGSDHCPIGIRLSI